MNEHNFRNLRLVHDIQEVLRIAPGITAKEIHSILLENYSYKSQLIVLLQFLRVMLGENKIVAVGKKDRLFYLPDSQYLETDLKPEDEIECYHLNTIHNGRNYRMLKDPETKKADKYLTVTGHILMRTEDKKWINLQTGEYEPKPDLKRAKIIEKISAEVPEVIVL